MKKITLFFACLLAVSHLLSQCADSVLQQYWTIYKASSSDVSFQYVDVTSDGKTVFAASTQSNVVRSTDGGCTWNESTVGDPGNAQQTIFSITALNDSTAFVCVKDFANINSHLYRTTDGGLTWDEPLPQGAYTNPGNRLFFVHFFNQSEGVACGLRSTNQLEFYTTGDSGASWLPVPPGNLPVLAGNIYFVGDRHAAIGNAIWIPTREGLILHTTDKGLTWTALATPAYPSTSYFYSTAFRDALHGIYITDLQEDYQTADGGLTWTPLAEKVPGSSIKHIPASNIYHVRTAYSMHMTVDDGSTWHEMDDWKITQPKFLNPTTAWAGGVENGTVQRWQGKTTIGRVDKPTLAIGKRKHLAEKPIARRIVLLDMGLAGEAVSTALNVVAPDSSIAIVQPGFGNINLPAGGSWKHTYEFAPQSTGIFDFHTFAINAFTEASYVDNHSLLLVTDTMIAKGDLNSEMVASDYATGGEGGSRFDFQIADTLTGLSVYYVGSYEPGLPTDANLRFYVRKLDPDGATPGDLLYQSPIISLTAADTQSMIFHPLAVPLTLLPGSYLVTFKPTFSDGEYRKFGYDPLRVDSSFWYKFDTFSTWETGVGFASILRLHLASPVLSPVPEPTEPAAFVQVYPNPTADYLQVDFNQQPIGKVQLQLTDMSGRIVLQAQLTDDSRLGLTGLQAGGYLLKIIATDKVWVERIVVQ